MSRRGLALASTSLGFWSGPFSRARSRANSRRSVSRRGLSVRLKGVKKAAFTEVMVANQARMCDATGAERAPFPARESGADASGPEKPRENAERPCEKQEAARRS